MPRALYWVSFWNFSNVIHYIQKFGTQCKINLDKEKNWEKKNKRKKSEYEKEENEEEDLKYKMHIKWGSVCDRDRVHS